jgi:hypothetical protein
MLDRPMATCVLLLLCWLLLLLFGLLQLQQLVVRACTHTLGRGRTTNRRE